MLEPNHVRAALRKSLPLFLIITQIIYKCNRNTHTHTFVGWAKHVLGQRSESSKTKKSMLLCPNQPLPTNKPGRERQSMCYDDKMEKATLHTALTTLPDKKQTKQNWPQAIYANKLYMPTGTTNVSMQRYCI